MQKDELKVNNNQLFNPTIGLYSYEKFEKLIKSFKLYQKLLLIIGTSLSPPLLVGLI